MTMSINLWQPNLVQLMIRHPNESALAADFDAEKCRSSCAA